MKGILFIDFLIQKEFLNTGSRQSSFPLTNQNAHLITYEPMKFRVTKVQYNTIQYFINSPQGVFQN